MTDRDPLDAILGRIDRPVSPSADFAQDLRVRLMAELERNRASQGDDQQMSTITALPATSRTPAAPTRLRRSSGRWMPRLEVAAAVLLILGIFATLGGPGAVRDQFAGLSFIKQEDDAALGPASMLGGDAGRTGQQPGPEPQFEFVGSWTLGVEGTSPLAFALVGLDDTVYRVVDTTAPADPNSISTRYLEAVDVISGTIRWRKALDVWGSPAVTAELVFVNLEPDRNAVPEDSEEQNRLPARLMALDAATGNEVWVAETGLMAGWMGNVSPIVIDDAVYTAAPNGTVYAFDGRTGEARWTSVEGASAETGEESRTGRPPISGSGQIAAGDGALYVVNTGGEVVAIDTETGAKRWGIAIRERFEIAPETVDLMVAPNGMVVMRIRGLDVSPGATTGDNAVDVFATVETATGLDLWRRDFDTFVGDPAIAGGLLIVPMYGATNRGSVLAINLSSADDVWTLTDTTPTPTGLSVAGNTIFLSGSDGNVTAIDAATGELRWYIPTQDKIAFPAVITREHLIVQGESGTLYAYNTDYEATPTAKRATPDGEPQNAINESTVVPPVASPEGV